MNAKSIALVSAIIASVTLIPGLLLFVGSIHSGGPSFFASMFIVPPLYLDYKGYVPAQTLGIFIVKVALLQFLLIFFIVSAYAWIKRKFWKVDELQKRT